MGLCTVFFFQAEDGIRDSSVTGVQTCALPIWLKIPCFDLGNSPDEYIPGIVGGRNIAMTTTNGTRALFRARQARRILIGALSNESAVVECLAAETGPVHLVCAGTEEKITLEDVLCAGGISHLLALAATRCIPAGRGPRLAKGLVGCGW